MCKYQLSRTSIELNVQNKIMEIKVIERFHSFSVTQIKM